jgi:uncharacterized membrane protein HdeD (DUF308 family)
MLSWWTRNWWVLALRGLFAVIFGVLAFIWPTLTLEALVIFFGVYTLVDGLVIAFNGLAERKLYPQWGRFLLMGLLSVIVGVITLIWPGITALVLLYLIAARALLMGIFEIIAAIQLRREIVGEWLLGFAGILSVLFGLALMIWPGSGALAIVWLIAGYAIVLGFAQIVLAFRLQGQSNWRSSEGVA